MSSTYEGSCLCGAVRFRLLAEPSMVSHCHCSMCRKGHSAAFATYLTMNVGDVRWLAGTDNLASYNSSSKIVRRFCRTCGSKVEWGGHPKYPDLVSIPLALLDTPFTPNRITPFYVESQVSWCNLA